MDSSADIAPAHVSCCVILAAGEGRRLSALENGRPKPTTEILGLSLGERIMLACMAAGVHRFVVVLGSQAEAVRAHFEHAAGRRGCAVDFVTAANWRRGNGLSTLAARDRVPDARFLLVMADHLVSPTLIQAVLRAPLGAHDVSLAVDHDTAQLFDPDDATKVRVEQGLIRHIGKQLRDWNAVDTGVFLATPALFDALAHATDRGRHALSDGGRGACGRRARPCRGRLRRTMDRCRYTREPPGSATPPAQVAGKKAGDDGYIAAHLNRRLSVPISARLARTPITPTQITVISFLIALSGAAVFTLDRFWTGVVGAVLVQFASVVDGCDGEIARLRHLATARGTWLDTMLDRYADSAVVVALTLGYATGHPGVLPWLGGFAAMTSFLLASYATKEFALRSGTSYPNDWLARLKHRDLRVFVIFCGGLIGYPFHAMVAVGVLTHVLIVGILCKGWALQRTTPGQVLAASTDVRPALAPAGGIEAPSDTV